MKTSNGNILKIVGLILTAVTLLGSAIASHYTAKEEAKMYTDATAAAINESVAENKTQETNHYQELKQDISGLREDAAVIKSILEYHFSAPRKAK